METCINLPTGAIVNDDAYWNAMDNGFNPNEDVEPNEDYDYLYETGITD